MSTPSEATVFAPASVGNVAVGFDVLGHALDAVGDLVTVRRTEAPGVVLRRVGGVAGPLPTEPARNTATAGLLRMIEALGLGFGFEVEIEKGIPLGSGMGGSAASAVGAVVAANALLPAPLTPTQLLPYAAVGEQVASGAMHGDNLAPGLFGGLTLVRSLEPPEVVCIPVPERIRCVLVHPHHRVDTREARAVLPKEFPLHSWVEQSANLAGFLAGLYAGDLALIGRSLRDVIVEPHRAVLVPGFRGVQRAAMEAGALGCSISGGGPSVFAWCDGDAAAEAACDAMAAAFRLAGLEADAWISRVAAAGARLVEAR